MLNGVAARTIARIKERLARFGSTAANEPQPKPLTKIVVHLGMPKAASTSIQLALHAAQDSLLTPAGIWFRAPDGEFSDYLLYDLLAAEELAGIREYLEPKILAATEAGADTVILSAERLFTIVPMQERLTQLASVLSEWADEVSFAVVVRELKPFMRSYIVQMVYNGALPLHTPRLAEWIADQAAAIETCGFPVHFLSLHESHDGRNIAEALLSATTGRELPIDMAVVNATPIRPVLYALAEGVASRLHSLDRSQDVNSGGMDRYRTEFANAFDRSVKSSPDRGEVHRVLYELDSLLETKIGNYIDQSLQLCEDAKLARYQALVTPPAQAEDDVEPVSEAA